MPSCVNGCGCDAGYTTGGAPKEFCGQSCRAAWREREGISAVLISPREHGTRVKIMDAARQGSAAAILILKRQFGLNEWIEGGVKYI